MVWYQFFRDGPEYEARRNKGTFTPPNITLKDLHDAVPSHLFERSTLRSLYFVFRHVAVSCMVYQLASYIDPLTDVGDGRPFLRILSRLILRPILWLLYWGWQGIAFAGLWCLGHEAGHGALSSYRAVNAAVGVAAHTFILTPYYAWRISHHAHHKSTNNLDRDVTYIPATRRDFGLPGGRVAVKMDYREIFEETPAFTMRKMLFRLFFGFQLYLIHNRKGNSKCPKGTSHYKPSSVLFKPEHRLSIIFSNIAIISMLFVLGFYGYWNGWLCLWSRYIMPWLFAHSWIVMVTYLQHSDPTIPYYRPNEWTFARGALATVDRPLFGWAGRFFLYNISTDHVAHHFFSTVPFYNLPQVTEAIKPVLGHYYNYDSTPAMYALWRSFTQCTFVENEGDIVFYKNRQGNALLNPHEHDSE